MKPRSPDSGFTLIEMMVTVAVLAILVAVAAPSFSDAMDRARIKSQAMRVIDVIEFAKSEATKSSITRNTAAGTWNTAVTINVTGGSSWSVVAQATDSDGNVTQRKASYEDVNGISIESPDSAMMTMNFRRIMTGDVDTAIVLQSTNGRQIQISVSATGRITACAVSTSIGDFTSC